MSTWRDDFYVYDVEIALEVDEVPGRWSNPEGMGFASGVVYSSAQDRYFFFVGEKRKRAMIELLSNKRVVSFNGVKFDSRNVLGNNRAWYPESGLTLANGIGWANFDILLEYVRSRFRLGDVGEAEAKLGEKGIHDGTFNLDALCFATLRRMKTGHGSKAPLLYKAGKIDELLEYNFNDVKITKELFEFILDYGFVVDKNGQAVRIEPPDSVTRKWA